MRQLDTKKDGKTQEAVEGINDTGRHELLLVYIFVLEIVYHNL